MDTNETFEHPGIALNPEAQGYLREAGKWAYFLGIMGFIGTGFVLLAALFIGTLMSVMSRFQPGQVAVPAAFGGLISFVYILVAILYFFFSLYLFKFGSHIKKGIMFSDEHEVTNALSKLKSFFKMWGITTIIIVSLYALFILIMIVVGVGAASMMRR